MLWKFLEIVEIRGIKNCITLFFFVRKEIILWLSSFAYWSVGGELVSAFLTYLLLPVQFHAVGVQQRLVRQALSVEEEEPRVAL